MELRQGKCISCKVAYRWPVHLMRLKDAHCPKCGDKLEATTHLLQWEWLNQNPICLSEAIELIAKEVN